MYTHEKITDRYWLIYRKNRPRLTVVDDLQTGIRHPLNEHYENVHLAINMTGSIDILVK